MFVFLNKSLVCFSCTLDRATCWRRTFAAIVSFMLMKAIPILLNLLFLAIGKPVRSSQASK
ncbi:hypothetical protein [Achromobacter spanius]|uniref:hypothetical protein n=1 Tax=Achromobacter spanius TaxID=217203 RepID=UPI003209A642